MACIGLPGCRPAIPSAESDPGQQAGIPLPPDLTEVAAADLASLTGLVRGSRRAQRQQRQCERGTGLPLEVETAKTAIRLRLIPPGKFRMGSPDDEDGRFGAEGPRHEVEITHGLYVGAYEVTQGQWEAVMGANPSRFQAVGSEAPVENVSWNDCSEFLEALCRKEGVPAGTYRLLTEAEWEYSCRAGTKTAFYTGDVTSPMGSDPALERAAWFGENAKGGSHPVAGRAANAWGLYDMLGNVWEWCGDSPRAYTSAAQQDPAGPSSGSHRICRGGGWLNFARLCRSAYRYKFSPGFRADFLGLRLARRLPRPGTPVRAAETPAAD